MSDTAVTGRAVFRTSRKSAVLLGTLMTLGALLCVLTSQSASSFGNGGAALVFFIAFVILGVSAVRLYWIAARPRRRLEVSGAGLTVGRGERWRELPWSELARVRVVTDRRKPWVVVWPRDPEAALSKWGKGFSAAHGGLRVFPVGHERRRRVRNRQVQELRAALSSHGGAVYDPSS